MDRVRKIKRKQKTHLDSISLEKTGGEKKLSEEKLVSAFLKVKSVVPVSGPCV